MRRDGSFNLEGICQLKRLAEVVAALYAYISVQYTCIRDLLQEQ